MIVDNRKGSLRISWQAFRLASARLILVSALILFAGAWFSPGATLGTAVPVGPVAAWKPLPNSGAMISWGVGKGLEKLLAGLEGGVC